MNLIEAPSDLKVVETDNGIEIVWSLALGNPDGCEVYHVKDNMGYELLSPTFITNSSFVFECPDTNKAYRILVAAIKLIRTPSGAYCAYSPGIIDTITPMRSFLPTPSFETMTLNDFGNVFFVNLSENLNAFYWSFRDVNTSIEENPQHQYSNEGNQSVILVTENGCDSDTFRLNLEIDIMTEISNLNKNVQIVLYPNPSNGQLFLKV